MEEMEITIDKCSKLEPSSRLKDGIDLKDLIQSNAADFTVDVSDRIDDELMSSGLESDDFGNRPLENANPSNQEGIANIPFKLPFDQLKERMNDVTEDGKIKKTIIKYGSIKKVEEGAIVYFHYNSYIENRDIPFDSSYQRSKPTRAQLGDGSLYSGFELCLRSMKMKENALFLVEPEYGFGSMGCPPRIPPNATLLLEIELLKVVEGGDVDNSDARLEDKANFKEACCKAKVFHILGNNAYKNGEIVTALIKYRKAENLLLSCKMASDKEEELCRKLLFKIYTNLCVCFNNPKLLSPERVCVAAREAFEIDPEKAKKSAKLYFHLGKAQLAFQSFDKAAMHLKKALSLEPGNKEIIELLTVVQQRKKKYNEHKNLKFQEHLDPNLNTKKLDIEPAAEFEETFRNQIEELVSNKIDKVQIPEGLTSKEKKLCKNISEEHGLKYEEVMICGKTNTYIRK